MEPLVVDGELTRSFDIDEAAKRAASDAEAVGFGLAEGDTHTDVRE
jgi:hypothetical protein